MLKTKISSNFLRVGKKKTPDILSLDLEIVVSIIFYKKTSYPQKVVLCRWLQSLVCSFAAAKLHTITILNPTKSLTVMFISVLFQGKGREGIAGHLHERSGDCSPASGLEAELLLHLWFLLLLGGRGWSRLRQPEIGVRDAGQTSAAQGFWGIQHLFVCLWSDRLWEVIHVSTFSIQLQSFMLHWSILWCNHSTVTSLLGWWVLEKRMV